MDFSLSVSSTIHVVSSALKIPAIVILLAFVVIVIFELGSLAVEIILVRRKANRDITAILSGIHGKSISEIKNILQDSGLLKQQITALTELLEHCRLAPATGQALARRLLTAEELRCQKVVNVTDFIVRLGPMFGLMATLIPLGPGLIALGQGDTKTLADSLLTAFDATVTGLATAGAAFVVSRLRKRWYEDDMSSMEAIMEGILEEIDSNENSIEEQRPSQAAM